MDIGLFDLQADPAAMRDAAAGWRTLAETVGSSWRDVVGERSQVLGTTWSGDAAESYGEHATRFGGDVATSRLAINAIASALESAADTLSEKQELLHARLSAVAELAYLPSVMHALLSEEGLAEVVEAAEDDARQIRTALDDELRIIGSDLMEANNTLRQLGDRWLPVAAGDITGWTPPPEVVGQLGVIRVGDRLILNLPDGLYPDGWAVVVETDPATGEQIVKAQHPGSYGEGAVEIYRAPPGANLVIRTGSGDDLVWLRAPGHTVISGSGNDIVDAGIRDDRDSTIVGLGGDDELYRDEGGRASGGAGDDRLFGYGRGVHVYGGLGDDSLSSGSHGYLSGGEGEDYLHSRPAVADPNEGISVMDAGAGDDTLIADNGGNTLRGGQGDDDITAGYDHASPFAGSLPDHVDGQGGRDRARIDDQDITESAETVSTPS